MAGHGALRWHEDAPLNRPADAAASFANATRAAATGILENPASEEGRRAKRWRPEEELRCPARARDQIQRCPTRTPGRSENRPSSNRELGDRRAVGGAKARHPGSAS